MEIYTKDYYLRLPSDSHRIDRLVSLLDLKSSDSVCEIGCAAGHFLAAISDKVRYGIGIDTSTAAIEAASELKNSSGLHNLDFWVGSAEDYSKVTTLAGSFDYVFLMDVTEHIEDRQLISVLCATRALLSPNGKLVIHTPNLDYWLERLKDRDILPQLDGHIAVRNLAAYVEILEANGFHIQNAARLPHYRQPLTTFDRLFMNFPFIGRIFAGRLFISARLAV